MSIWRVGIFWFWLQGLVSATLVWQPVTDYSISFRGDREKGPPEINPFENFTHMGADFGWMGPGETRIEAKAGIIRVKPDGEWTGAWHSLAGLAVETNRAFDPTDALGLGGPAELRAPVRAVTLDVRGVGELRVELLDANRRLIWERRLTLASGERSRQRFEVTAGELGRLKYLNWVAEAGCEAEISSIGFEIERPDIEPEKWLFAVSLGKLRRCHDPESGLTRDRAHVPPGLFDSIASTGMHALASAAGAAEGILNREMVAEEIRMTTAVVLGLPKAAGFLPHFTRTGETGVEIHPGTEYSTVDTAIALHGLALAAEILHLVDVSDAVEAAVTSLDFDAVTDSEGWISHGFLDDKKTLLPGRWRDWGGETALVLAMEAMIPNRAPRGRMESGGRVYRGVEFIIELQSLFYPDFDRTEPDMVSGTVWPNARRSLLNQQASYPSEQWPDSPAARMGIFGISAGESGMPGAGYSANGVEMTGLRWLYPHAMVMGLAMSGGNNFAQGIGRLEQAGFLFPMGLPENIEIGLVLHNPMQGSLNAAFESIASYHGWRRAKGGPDVIDQASQSDALMRTGAARFYR